MSRRVTIAGRCAFASFAGLAGFSVYRARLVEASYGRYTGCEGCLQPSVWANDAFLVAGFAALLAMSRLTANRLARAVLAGLATGMVVAYCLDIVVSRLLTQRLLAVDLFHFAGDAALLLTVLEPLARRPEGWLLLAGAAATIACAGGSLLFGPAKPWAAGRWGAVSGVLLLLASAPRDLAPRLPQRIAGPLPRRHAPRGALRAAPQPDAPQRARGDQGAAQFTLLLDGDDTRWLEAPARKQDAERLLDQVNLERMARMDEFRASP